MAYGAAMPALADRDEVRKGQTLPTLDPAGRAWAKRLPATGGARRDQTLISARASGAKISSTDRRRWQVPWSAAKRRKASSVARFPSIP